MYQKPDFVKVDINVKDNFASYTACDAIISKTDTMGESSSITNCSLTVISTKYFIESQSPVPGNYQCYNIQDVVTV